MADVTELLADLAALKRARRTGARSVTIGKEIVEYRSDSELAAAIAATVAAPAPQPGSTSPTEITAWRRASRPA